MSALDPQDEWRLLNLPVVGVVGTLRRDGSPRLCPVWYTWSNGQVLIWTSEKRLWVQDIARDARVAFSVQENSAPFSAVLIRGHADVMTDSWAGFDEAVREITRRYVEAADVDSYIAGWVKLRSVVRIHPDHATSWGAEGLPSW